MTQQMTQAVAMIIMIISVASLIVSVTTEVIKNIGKLKDVATNIVVFVLSIIVTITAMIAYFQINSIHIYWYYILAGIFASFFVSLAATNGWKFIFDIWNKVRGEITLEEWNKQAEEVQAQIDEKNSEV